VIPVIVVSGRAGLPNQKRAIKAGAKAFLEKPVDNAELLAVIRQALGESAEKEKAPIHDLGSVEEASADRQPKQKKAAPRYEVRLLVFVMS
jgi:FixJ family two-component response regulator